MKRMIKENHWKKGVFTVEAAVIVPLAASMIALLIGYCYFAHQINWYKGAAFESAAAGLKEPANAASAAEEQIRHRSSESPIGFGEETADVSSGIKLSVSFEGKVLEDVFGNLFSYRGEAALTRFDPVKVKRLEFVLERMMG